MQIVTDSGADLVPEQMEGLPIYKVPLNIVLQGKTYASGIDLQPAEFYALLEETGAFPTTSMPSAGEFADTYRRLAQNDPDILSIHISSGLSGTLNTARAGAAMVPEANITFFDSLTLSCPLGWMVQFAGKAIQAGWDKESILAQLEKIRPLTQGLFTLSTMKYLLHGGRISHIKSLVATVLNIKPIIGPEKVTGAYAPYGQGMTLKRTLHHFPEVIAHLFPDMKRTRVQLLHGQNLEAVEILREAMSARFDCHFDPVAVIAPVLGAHTGPTVVGLGVGDMDVFAGLV